MRSAQLGQSVEQMTLKLYDKSPTMGMLYINNRSGVYTLDRETHTQNCSFAYELSTMT